MILLGGWRAPPPAGISGRGDRLITPPLQVWSCYAACVIVFLLLCYMCYCYLVIVLCVIVLYVCLCSCYCVICVIVFLLFCYMCYCVLVIVLYVLLCSCYCVICVIVLAKIKIAKGLLKTYSCWPSVRLLDIGIR